MARIDDDTPDPREDDLARRSGNPTVPVWLVIAGLLLLGAVVFFVSAL